MNTKHCIICGKEMRKNRGESASYFADKKCCSVKCRGIHRRRIDDEGWYFGSDRFNQALEFFATFRFRNEKTI